MFGRSCVAVLLLLASVALGRADEAVRRDGSRVAGNLTLTEAGRFEFHAGKRIEPAADIDIVRFAGKSPAIAAAPLWHQIRIGRDELLLGVLLKLDATHLYIRTSWRDCLAVPRSAIERVTNAPGMRPVFFDTFDGDLSAWTTASEPRIAAGTLTFNRPAQSVAAKLNEPLPAGQIEIGFESARTATRRLALELEFVRAGKPNTVQVELVGPTEHYVVQSPDKPTRQHAPRRHAGRSRASVEFDGDRLDIFVDDLVLWTQPKGPGELRAIKIAAAGEGSESVAVHDVLIAKPQRMAEPKAWADLTADAVRSPNGDETFGKLMAVGPAGLLLEVKDRQIRRGWPEVGEFAFRRAAVAEQATVGEHVQARIRSVNGVRDVLTGAVKSFDANALVLIHPVLGELKIPRERLTELRLLFHGRLIPIDSTPRHLGSRSAFGFAVPKPEGLRLAKTHLLRTESTDALVVVDAAHLTEKGVPVEVRINDEPIGELNRLANRSDGGVRSYRLPLPAIHAGEIELELRLRPSPDGGGVRGIDLRALRLEIHEPR